MNIIKDKITSNYQLSKKITSNKVIAKYKIMFNLTKTMGKIIFSKSQKTLILKIKI
jgi:hypothetical protein